MQVETVPTMSRRIGDSWLRHAVAAAVDASEILVLYRLVEVFRSGG